MAWYSKPWYQHMGIAIAWLSHLQKHTMYQFKVHCTNMTHTCKLPVQGPVPGLKNLDVNNKDMGLACLIENHAYTK